MVYAAWNFSLSRCNGKGVSLRRELESVVKTGSRSSGRLRRQADEAAARLKPPVKQVRLSYLLDWFRDLSRGRQSNGFGPCPLSWQDLRAWSGLLGIGPDPWEIRTLLMLDACWLAANVPPASMGNVDD